MPQPIADTAEPCLPAAHAIAPPPDGLAAEAAPERTQLHAPVNIRSLSLAVLALLASLWALHVASAVFIPLALGLMLSYALSPVVDRLAQHHVPRALGAAVLLLSMGGGLGWTAYAVSDDATALVESLPEATEKVRVALRGYRGASESAIDKVQRAASQLELAAQEGRLSAPRLTRGVTRVSIERSRFDISDYFLTGTLGMVASVGQAVVVVFIAFFLLASGSSFRRKMVRLAGPRFAQKRVTVQVLDEVTGQIQRYLLVQVLLSVVVGLATWAAFALIGLQHAAVWGVAAFALNFVPYIGSIVLAAGAALVAFVQFGSFDTTLLVAGVALVLHTVTGNLLTPWLTSRTNRLNPLAVFVGVLAFGWLWGAWGLLLGVPILTTVKAVCDRVDDLKAVGELLGN